MYHLLFRAVLVPAITSCLVPSISSCLAQQVTDTGDRQPASRRSSNLERSSEDGELFLAHTLFDILGGEKESLNMLAVPVVLPNLTTDAAQLPQELDFVARVPQRSPLVLSATDRTISAQMKRLSPTIEILAERTPQEEAEYQSLRANLYLPSGEKNLGYRDYEVYAQQLRELREKMEKATKSTAESIQLQMRERALRDDWREHEHANEIENAALKIRRYDRTEEVAMLKAWKSLIADDTHPVVRWSSLSDLNVWQDRSASTAAPHALLLKGTRKVDSTVESVAAKVRPGDVSIALRYRRVAVNHPSLSGEALTSPLWTSATLRISAGSEGGDDPNDLVPRAIAEVIVAKELEFMLVEDGIRKQVSTFLDEHTDVSIGGLPVAEGSHFTLPGSLTINAWRPAVIAVIVKGLPKSPVAR